MKYDIILFDLDGTLLDTLEDLMDSVNYVMEQKGWQTHSLDAIRGFVGNGIRQLMECATPEGDKNPEFEEGFQMFRGYYLEHNRIKTRPYEGVLKLLQGLKEIDMPMAIVTNKNQPSVDALVQEVFEGTVMIAVGDDGIRARKPAAEPVREALSRLRREYAHRDWAKTDTMTEEEWISWIRDRVLYVGDSEVDAQTAQNAGVDCGLCTWGFRSLELLEALPHAALFHHPGEIKEFLG